MGDEDSRKRKTMRIEDVPESSSSGKDKCKARSVDDLSVPRMESVEEILSVYLFPGKIGMTTNIGAKMEPRIQKHVTECIRRNVDVFCDGKICSSRVSRCLFLPSSLEREL